MHPDLNVWTTVSVAKSWRVRSTRTLPGVLRSEALHVCSITPDLRDIFTRHFLYVVLDYSSPRELFTHTHTLKQVLDNTNWDQSETLLLPPFHGLELESMIEESPDVDDENEEEDSRGKWKTYVIPKVVPCMS